MGGGSCCPASSQDPTCKSTSCRSWRSSTCPKTPRMETHRSHLTRQSCCFFWLNTETSSLAHNEKSNEATDRRQRLSPGPHAAVVAAARLTRLSWSVFGVCQPEAIPASSGLCKWLCVKRLLSYLNDDAHGSDGRQEDGAEPPSLCKDSGLQGGGSRVSGPLGWPTPRGHMVGLGKVGDP